MKVQVGSPTQYLDGFHNVRVASIPDGAVECLFSRAFFEHLLIPQQAQALREWKRLLAPGGVIVALGIPDFAATARCYLDGAPGVVGDRFDLLDAYRYTHGAAELAAPGGMPRLHKAIFDAAYLHGLASAVGLAAAVFNYCLPGEMHPVNLGFVAVPEEVGAPPAGEVARVLASIPGFRRLVAMPTLTLAPRPRGADAMLTHAMAPAEALTR